MGRRFPAVPRALLPAFHAASEGAAAAGIARGQHVTVAVSGGADSAVMLAVVALLGPRRGVGVRAVHVDHGLSAAAPLLQHGARALAEHVGVPLDVVRVVVKRSGEGVEAAARRARHAALAQVATEHGSTWVALGHTATDVAETYLQRLMEGAGRGQSVLRAHERNLWRPLWSLTREEVRAAARAVRLPVVEDPMNDDPSLLRTFLRHQVFPLLATRFGSPDRTLARAAAWAHDDHDALEQQAAQHWREGAARRSVLARLPRAVSLRVLRQMVEHAAGQPVRTGGEAVSRADAELRSARGERKRFKAGPVWLVVDRESVTATRG